MQRESAIQAAFVNFTLASLNASSKVTPSCTLSGWDFKNSLHVGKESGGEVEDRNRLRGNWDRVSMALRSHGPTSRQKSEVLRLRVTQVHLYLLLARIVLLLVGGDSNPAETTRVEAAATQVFQKPLAKGPGRRRRLGRRWTVMGRTRVRRGGSAVVMESGSVVAVGRHMGREAVLTSDIHHKGMGGGSQT